MDVLVLGRLGTQDLGHDRDLHVVPVAVPDGAMRFGDLERRVSRRDVDDELLHVRPVGKLLPVVGVLARHEADPLPLEHERGEVRQDVELLLVEEHLTIVVELVMLAIPTRRLLLALTHFETYRGLLRLGLEALVELLQLIGRKRRETVFAGCDLVDLVPLIVRAGVLEFDLALLVKLTHHERSQDRCELAVVEFHFASLVRRHLALPSSRECGGDPRRPRANGRARNTGG